MFKYSQSIGMGSSYTLRNRHRKKKFLQVAGAGPRINNLRRSLGEETSAVDRAKLTETLRRNEQQRRNIAQAAKNLSIAELNKKKAEEANTRVPVHPDEYRADSLATIVREKLKDMTNEILTRIKETTAKIRIKANEEINAARSRLDELTIEEKATKDAVDNFFIPINGTQSEIVIANSKKALLNARLEAIRQSVIQINGRIEAIQLARARNIELASQKINIESRIHFEQRIVQNIIVIAPIIQKTTFDAHKLFGFSYLQSTYGYGATNTTKRLTQAIDDTRSSQRTIENITLLRNNDPITITKFITEKNTSTKILITKNEKLKTQLMLLVSEAKSKINAIPSLLDTARSLTTNMDAAIKARTELETSLLNLSPPDYTDLVNRQAEIRAEISILNKNINDISIKLENIENDIINAVGARDFLIAKKAEFEDIELKNLQNDIVETEPDYNTSKTNYENEQRNSESINKILSDIDLAVAPYRTQRTGLFGQPGEIRRNIQYNLLPVLDGKAYDLAVADLLRREAITSLLQTIKQNANDIARLVGVNNDITKLRKINGDHDILTEQIRDALDSIGRLQIEDVTRTSDSEGNDRLLNTILEHLKYNIEPALVITQSNESTSREAYVTANSNLTTVTERISSNRSEIESLIKLQNIITDRILRRTASEKNVLYEASRASSHALRIAAETRSSTASKPNTYVVRGNVDVINNYRDAKVTAETELGTVNGFTDSAIAAVALNRPLKAAAEDGIRNVGEESASLPPAIAREEGQLTSLEGELGALGPRPDEPTVPVLIHDPRPDSSADRAELGAIQVPSVDSNRVPEAEAAKKATIDAVIAGLGQDSAVALKTATDAAASLRSRLTTIDEPALDLANIDVSFAKDANESTAKTFKADEQFLSYLDLESAAEAVREPDTGPTTRAEEDVIVKINEFPAVVERPSRTPEGIEALSRAPQLESELTNVLAEIIRTEVNKNDTERDIANKPGQIRDASDNVDTARSLVEILRIDVLGRAEETGNSSTLLQNAESSIGALTNANNTSTARIATDTQVVSVLDTLEQLNAQHASESMNATNGSLLFDAARQLANSQRRTADSTSPIATKPDTTIGSPSEVNVALGRKSNAETELGTVNGSRDSAIAAAALNGPLKDAANDGIRNVGEESASLPPAIRREGEQATRLEGELGALGTRPDEPTVPVLIHDPRPDSSADRAELDTLNVPEVDSNRVPEAEAAKKATVDAVIAGLGQDSAVALKTATDDAARKSSDLTNRDGPALDGANRDVSFAKDANESTAKTLKADEQFLSYLDLESAAEAVREPDPEPTTRAEEDVIVKNEQLLEIRPVERPSRVPPPPDLSAPLAAIKTNIYTLKILKDENDDDIADTNIFNIDTTLFDSTSADLSRATIKFTNAALKLDDAFTTLDNSIRDSRNIETLINNLHDATRSLDNILTERTDSSNTLTSLNNKRDAYKALGIAQKNLRTAMTTLPTAVKDNINARIDKIKADSDALRGASVRKETAVGEDAAITRTLGELESVREDAHVDAYENISLAGSFMDHVNLEATIELALNDGYENITLAGTFMDRTDVFEKLLSEGEQATRLEGELEALGTRPDEPTVPILIGPQKPDSSADRAELDNLNVPEVDSNRVPNAEAAKDNSVQDAQTARDARLQNSEGALKTSTEESLRLTTELETASTTLEIANKDVANADAINDTNIINKNDAETRAKEMDDDIKNLKGKVKEIKDKVDETQRILDSIRFDDLPPHQDAPDVPIRPPDQSENLARLNELIDDLNRLKADTDILIKNITDDSPILKDRIENGIENLRYMLIAFDSATTKRLQEGAKLALEKVKIEILDGNNTNSKERNATLKKIVDSLEKFSDKLNQRRIDMSKIQGISRNHAEEQDAARRAREAATNAEKLAIKDDIDTNRMDDLSEELQRLKDKRDSNEEDDEDLNRRIEELEEIINILNENIRAVRQNQKDIDEAQRLKDENDEEIRKKIKEIEDLKKKIKDENDPEKRKRLEDDLEAARKRLQDLENLRKKIKDDLDILIRERDRLLKERKMLDDLLRKLENELKVRNKSNLNISLPLGIGAVLAGLLGAAFLGASAFSGPVAGPLKLSDLDKDDCDEGTAAGTEDGKRVGQEEGKKAGLAAKDAADQSKQQEAQQASRQAAQQEAQNSGEGADLNSRGPTGPTEPTESIESTNSTGPTGGVNNINIQNAGNPEGNTGNTGTNSTNSNNTNTIPTSGVEGEEAPEEAPEEEPIAEAPEVPEVPVAPVAEEEVIEEAPEPPTPYPYPRSIFPTNSYKSCYIKAFNKIYPKTWKAYWLEGRTGKPADTSNLSPSSKDNNIYYVKSDKYGIDGYFNYIDSADGEYYEYINNDKTVFILVNDIKDIISSTYSPANESTANENKILNYRIDGNIINETMNENIIKEYSSNGNDSKIKKATYLVFQSTDEPVYKIVALYTDINEGIIEVTLDGKNVNPNELIEPSATEGEETAVEDVEVEIPDETAGGGNISDNEEVIPTF
jgi:hypothetical protein